MPPKKKDVETLTSTDVSKVLHTSVRTVCAYMDDGRLVSWRMPSRTKGAYKDRRTNVWNILQFCEEFNLPIDLVKDWIIENFCEEKWKIIVKNFQEKRKLILRSS